MNYLKSVWDEDVFNVTWVLGKRCNYACSYCPATCHDNTSKHKEIEKLKIGLDKISKIHPIINLTIGGGEPTVSPFIDEFLFLTKLNKINHVTLHTNGTRPVSWFIDNYFYINKTIISLHFEYNWIKVKETILNLTQYKDFSFFVVVMLHPQYFNEGKKTIEQFDDKGIKYIVRKIRTNIENYYTPEQELWMLEKNATEKLDLILNGVKWSSNDLIKKEKNKFKGWKCHAGIKDIMIDSDGTILRSFCGATKPLGNIFTDKIIIPKEPIICPKDSCMIVNDLQITKTL